jgi:hypothetical protein
MMKTIVSLSLLALLASPALADTPAAKPVPPRSCFYINQFEGWKAPDNRTIFIRVNTNRYYRLDLASACQTLTYPDAFLITKTRGPDTVCSAIDWDLRVGQSAPRGFATPCIVKTMSRMTPDEVAAIPKKFKP